MSSINTEIKAEAKILFDILNTKKYEIDVYQREYKWEKKHIEQLLIDLESAFIANFVDGHNEDNVDTYNSYYLGPIVICDKNNITSIVDGQQRLTSITLLLIYLNNLQKSNSDPVEIETLIYSKKGTKRTYNLVIPERTEILDSLFLNKEFDIESNSDFSVRNMYDRYEDIKEIFPISLKDEKLPVFIEWLKHKIILVEILAHSDENAYTIFETMNDRGLNLSPTEMLKGYLLTCVKDLDKIQELNNIWKSNISKLHQFSTEEDLEFIRAWLRSQHAISIRQGAKDSENMDFELIGTKFHNWVNVNHKKLGLNDPDAYYFFIKGNFSFYSNIYLKIKNAEENLIKGLESLYLTSWYGIASSLSYPLLLASINIYDDEETINKKLEIVSKFIDNYIISRVINNKSITQVGIRYTLNSLIVEIRNTDIENLKEILRKRLKVDSIQNIITYNFDGNRKFLHYFLARIIYYIEKELYEDKNISFNNLMVSRVYNRFILSQLVSNNDDYLNYFGTEESLQYSSNLLGNFVLVPNPLYEAYSIKKDLSKIELLSNINNFTASLNETFYTNDKILKDFEFKPISEFSQEQLINRTNGINNLICDIWNPNNL